MKKTIWIVAVVLATASTGAQQPEQNPAPDPDLKMFEDIDTQALHESRLHSR